MARYISNISANINGTIHRKVTTANNSPIGNITVNGVTYTRVLSEINPVQLNYGVPTDTPHTISASTTSANSLRANVNINLYGAMGDYAVVGNTGIIEGDVSLERANVSTQNSWGPLQIAVQATGSGEHTGSVTLNISSSGNAISGGILGPQTMYRTFTFPYNLNISYSPSLPSYPDPTPPVAPAFGNYLGGLFVVEGMGGGWGNPEDSWIGDLESGLDFPPLSQESNHIFVHEGDGAALFSSMDKHIDDLWGEIMSSSDNTPHTMAVVLTGPLYPNNDPNYDSIAKSFIEQLISYGGFNNLSPGDWDSFTVIIVGGVPNDVKDMQSQLEQYKIWVIGLEIAPPIDAINILLSMGTTADIAGNNFPCMIEYMPVATSLGTLLQIARGDFFAVDDAGTSFTITTAYSDMPAIRMPYGIVTSYEGYGLGNSIGCTNCIEGDATTRILYEYDLQPSQVESLLNYYNTWNYENGETNFEGEFYPPIKLWSFQGTMSGGNFENNMVLSIQTAAFEPMQYEYPLLIFDAESLSTLSDNIGNTANQLQTAFEAQNGNGIFIDPYGLSQWADFMQALDSREALNKSFCLYVNPYIVTILKALINKWDPLNPNALNDNLLFKKKSNFAVMYNYNGEDTPCTSIDDTAWYVPFNYVQVSGFDDSNDQPYQNTLDLLGFNQNNQWPNIMEFAIPSYVHQLGGNTFVMPYYVSKTCIGSMLYTPSSPEGDNDYSTYFSGFVTTSSCLGIGDK